MIIILLLIVSATVSSAQSEEQKTAVPNKLFISYGPAGAFLKTENSDGSFGGGSALTLGWNFTPDFSLYLTSMGYHMDKANFTNSEPDTYFRWGINGLGFRYSFMNWRRTRLYADGAFLQSSLRPDLPERVVFSGNGFSAGAGIQHFVAPQWSVSAGIVYVYSHFRKKVEDDRTIDFKMTGHGVNVNAGFAWHPYANRNNSPGR